MKTIFVKPTQLLLPMFFAGATLCFSACGNRESTGMGSGTNHTDSPTEIHPGTRTTSDHGAGTGTGTGATNTGTFDGTPAISDTARTDNMNTGTTGGAGTTR